MVGPRVYNAHGIGSPQIPSRKDPMRSLQLALYGSYISLAAALACRAANPAQSPAQPPAPPPIDIYDGFESPTLSNLWEQSRFAPGAVEIQSDVVRAGRGAVRITVRPRDMFEAGQNGDADSERDELLEARRLVSRENTGYEFSFSMYFLKDFPIVPTRLVIAQWKQYCPGLLQGASGPCSNDSPVLALRYISGELRITQDIDKKFVMLYREKGEFRGRWLDFRIQARFTPGADGRVKVWLDGRQLVDYTGATADPENPQSGYSSPGVFYFKMGLYRDLMTEPMTVYIDEYRKRQLRDGEL
jgi:hypothetical protein